MPLILPGNVASATASTTYDVDNSCRFNKADNAYHSKSLGTPTDADKFTISFWMKLGLVSSTVRTIFNIAVSGGANTFMQLTAADLMVFGRYDSGYQGNLTTTQVFRDPSAWYSIIVVYDSGNATAGNRMRLYVNGTEVTSFGTDTNPDQDLDSSNVSGATFFVGAYGDDDEEFDGYLAEFCFIDGLALTPSSFGEFNEDTPTVFQPIDVSGLTFGTNGFYLDFEDSANLGNDANGGTDLTETNLAATDQATDTPTNNFCTISPLYKHVNFTFSEGNCKMVTHVSSDSYGGGIGTFGLTAGKWYWEVKIASLVSNHNHGAISELCPELYNLTEHPSALGALQIKTGVTCWRNDDGGEIVIDGTASTEDYGLYSDGEIMGIALDIDNYNISYYQDGVALASDVNMSSTRGTIFPFLNTGINTTTEINFGGCSAFTISSAASDANGYGNFEYAPPSGYLALCSKNLGSDGG